MDTQITGSQAEKEKQKEEAIAYIAPKKGITNILTTCMALFVLGFLSAGLIALVSLCGKPGTNAQNNDSSYHYRTVYQNSTVYPSEKKEYDGMHPFAASFLIAFGMGSFFFLISFLPLFLKRKKVAEGHRLTVDSLLKRFGGDLLVSNYADGQRFFNGRIIAGNELLLGQGWYGCYRYGDLASVGFTSKQKPVGRTSEICYFLVFTPVEGKPEELEVSFDVSHEETLRLMKHMKKRNPSLQCNDVIPWQNKFKQEISPDLR